VEHPAGTDDWHLLCGLDEIRDIVYYVTGYAFMDRMTSVRASEHEVGVLLNVWPIRQKELFQAAGSFVTHRNVRCPYHGWSLY
ncbi:hypothetical protein AAHH79_37090, partial [Burkholderia pseudomallei]